MECCQLPSQSLKDITPNVRNSQKIIEDLKQDDRIRAISPLLSTQVFYNNGPVADKWYSYRSVNILEEAKLFGLDTKMKSRKTRRSANR